MDTRNLEANLAERYKYHKLTPQLSEEMRQLYELNVPSFLSTAQPLYTSADTLICSSFNRIVIGDYGAFVEFSPGQANRDVYCIAPGQEYRLEERYKNCKYIWLTIPDSSHVKNLLSKAYGDICRLYPRYVLC